MIVKKRAQNMTTVEPRPRLKPQTKVGVIDLTSARINMRDLQYSSNSSFKTVKIKTGTTPTRGSRVTS